MGGVTLIAALLKSHSWHPVPVLLYSKLGRADGIAEQLEGQLRHQDEQGHGTDAEVVALVDGIAGPYAGAVDDVVLARADGVPAYASTHFNLFRAAAGRLAEHWHSVRALPGPDVPLPEDVVVAPAFAADAPASVRGVAEVQPGDMILDIGPRTAARYADLIARAGTVVWNGPVGVFEFDAFGKGTEALARAIAASSAFSIAGGGDTLAAIDKYGVAGDVGYISTGGGAFLEFLEGKTLPAVAALEARGG